MISSPFSLAPAGTVPGSRLITEVKACCFGPGGRAARINYKPAAERKSRVKGAPRDIRTGNQGMVREAQCEPGEHGKAADRSAPAASRRRLAQAAEAAAMAPAIRSAVYHAR